MADAADAAKATVDKVKSVVTLLADLTGKSEATDTATAEASADIAGAHAAVAAYRKTARWILAAFSAVALIVFGTLPFANITQLRGFVSHLCLMLGLALVGLGVVLAVRAVASTMTPVSASLGELSAEEGGVAAQPSPQLQAAPRSRLEPPGGQRAWKALWPWVEDRWWQTFSDAARTAEMQRLKAVLCGPENASHFGPGITTVEELIQRITQLDAERVERLPAAQAEAVRLQAAVDRRSMLAAQLEALRAELVELKTASLPEEQKSEVLEPVRARIAVTSRELDAARTTEVQALLTAGACGAALAKTMAARDVYLFHRSMVLDSYGVSLVRAAFLRARGMLVAAAALTLLGAVNYALALPPDPTRTTPPPRLPGLPRQPCSPPPRSPSGWMSTARRTAHCRGCVAETATSPPTSSLARTSRSTGPRRWCWPPATAPGNSSRSGTTKGHCNSRSSPPTERPAVEPFSGRSHESRGPHRGAVRLRPARGSRRARPRSTRCPGPPPRGARARPAGRMRR